jgi:protein-glutamine gamma-glutamyltransferase
MITINNAPFDILAIKNKYSNHSIQSFILSSLTQARETVNFPTIDALTFELDLRSAMVSSAIELSQSNLGFATFRESKCNGRYWIRRRNGGFQVLQTVKPSDAILDIYRNGNLYATECATAMVIVLYHALLSVYSAHTFNRLFPSIYLMNWHNLDPKIAEIGYLRPTTYYLPGDRRYFYNPDVAPENPEWQGENAIELTQDRYYAHDFGIVRSNEIISALNESRKKNAATSAFLRNGVGRPDFDYLFQLKNR